MNPAAIIALLNAITTLIPAGMQLAAEVKSSSSLEDQASVDAALTAMVSAANAELTKAEADLDAAAKT